MIAFFPLVSDVLGDDEHFLRAESLVDEEEEKYLRKIFLGVSLI
jgi:hypothetical protein